MAERIALHESTWQLACVPGSSGTHGGPEESDWFDIPSPTTVRHAHRALGRDLPDDWDELEWWYRCRFSRPKGKERVVRLSIGAVDYRSEAYINGDLLGENRGAYGPTYYDISNVLEDENDLTIRVQPAAYSGDRLMAPNRHPLRYENPGLPRYDDIGLWDDVNLFVSGPIYFDGWLVHAIPDGKQGELNVRLDVNNTRQTAEGMLRIVLEDAAGKQVLKEEQSLGMATGLSRHDLTFYVPDIHAWNPHTHGDPYLYRLRFELALGGGVVDAVEQSTGFRKVRVNRTGTGEAPWRVTANGQQVPLRGINWAGLPLQPELSYTDLVETLRGAGVNAIRVWGGRHRRSFYDACDQAGILVLQEMPYGLLDGLRYPMQAADFPEGKELVNAARLDNNAYALHLHNHPSIYLWVGGTRIHNQDNAHIMRTAEEALRLADGTRPYVAAMPVEGVRLDDAILLSSLSPEHYEDASPLLIATGLPGWAGDVPDSRFPDRWRKYGGTNAQARAVAWAAGGQRFERSAGCFVGEVVDWSLDGGYGLHDFHGTARPGWQVLRGMYAPTAAGLSFDWKAYDQGTFDAEVWAARDDGVQEASVRVWVTDHAGTSSEEQAISGGLENGVGTLGEVSIPLQGQAPFTAWVAASDNEPTPYALDVRKPPSSYTLAEVYLLRQRIILQQPGIRFFRDLKALPLAPVEFLFRGVFALRLAMGV